MLRVSFILNNGSGCSYHGVISTDAIRNKHKAEIQRADWIIIAYNFLGKLLFSWLNGLCHRSFNRIQYDTLALALLVWSILTTSYRGFLHSYVAFFSSARVRLEWLSGGYSDWTNLFSELLVMLRLLPNNTRCVYSIICFRNQRIIYSPMFDSWPPTTQGRLGIGRTVTDCHMLDYMKWQPYKVRGRGLS